MEPPRPALTISRSAKRETRNTPVRSTFRSRSQSSTDTEVTDALRTMMPALLTSTSIPPSPVTVAWTMRSAFAGDDTSPWTETARPLPNPITPEARPFWDGLRERKLLLPRCQACGHVFFYPRVLCPRCHARDNTWIQASGKGRLHAFEIAYQAFHKAWKVKPPYVLAMVELAEGPRLMSNLVNVEPDPRAIKCDMPVRVVFSKLTDEVTPPLFEPGR